MSGDRANRGGRKDAVAKQDAVAQCGYSVEMGDRRKNDEKSGSDSTTKVSAKGETGRDRQYEERD